MENENLTPSPEQPRYTPPASPFHIPAPFVEEPPLPPQEAAQPEYQEPAEPQYAPPAEPQYASPAEPQYAPPAQPEYAPLAETEYAPPAQPQYEQYRQPYEQPQERPQETEQPKKKSKRRKILLPVACVLVLAMLAGAYFLFLRKPSGKRIELENDVYLKTGDVFTLDYTVEAETVCEWTSSNESVAAVRDGTVTAVGEGSCVISLQAGGAKAECRLTVVSPPANGASIVGTWHYDGAFIDDVYYGTADCRLTVYADGRAALAIDGENTGLTWRAANSEAGMEYFDVTADDGTVCKFWYYAATGGDYAGKLVLYGDDANMFIFKK